MTTKLASLLRHPRRSAASRRAGFDRCFECGLHHLPWETCPEDKRAVDAAALDDAPLDLPDRCREAVEEWVGPLDCPSPRRIDETTDRHHGDE